MTLQPWLCAKARKNARKYCISFGRNASENLDISESCKNARFDPGALLSFTHFLQCAIFCVASSQQQPGRTAARA
ncbi:hypothetical protein [Pandoraea pneumonica]|uniref:hypothetical protein n=1 Tax=Pandoraea pneumonica TaxID=2508299 RepID=UPI003CF992E8